MSEGMSGPLDLGDADLSGFDALDSGRYDAEVFKVEWDAVKNESGKGKMPKGTPMLKIQYRILNPRINNEPIEQDRRVFQTLISPPRDYDVKKAAMMKGMIVRFFTALGFDENEVMGGSFDPDFEDLKGRACTVTIGKVQKKDSTGELIEGEYNNPVKGVKPAGAEAATAGSNLL